MARRIFAASRSRRRRRACAIDTAVAVLLVLLFLDVFQQVQLHVCAQGLDLDHERL